MERRFLPSAASDVVVSESRAEDGGDGQVRLSGHAAVYYDGTPATEFPLWDGAVERIMPGAFDRAVREDDVRALFNHAPDNLLGRTTSGTLRLGSDETGLTFDIDKPPTQLGDDVAASIKRRDITGSSFSFIIKPSDEEWRTEDGQKVREIRSFTKVFDVGPVTFPAYESTTAGVRSADATDARSSYDAWQQGLNVEMEARKRKLRLAEMQMK